MVLFFLIAAVVGPRITTHHPHDYVGPSGAPPSAEYWFGTTTFGQDVFSQFIHGLGATFIVGRSGS